MEKSGACFGIGVAQQSTAQQSRMKRNCLRGEDISIKIRAQLFAHFNESWTITRVTLIEWKSLCDLSDRNLQILKFKRTKELLQNSQSNIKIKGYIVKWCFSQMRPDYSTMRQKKTGGTINCVVHEPRHSLSS